VYPQNIMLKAFITEITISSRAQDQNVVKGENRSSKDEFSGSIREYENNGLRQSPGALSKIQYGFQKVVICIMRFEHQV